MNLYFISVGLFRIIFILTKIQSATKGTPWFERECNSARIKVLLWAWSLYVSDLMQCSNTSMARSEEFRAFSFETYDAKYGECVLTTQRDFHLIFSVMILFQRQKSNLSC